MNLFSLKICRDVRERPRNQSGLAPENLTTLPHFSVSSATSFLKSAGEPASAANAVAYLNRADAYMSKGDYGRAIQDYDEGIQFDSMNANAHSNRGRAYFHQGDFKAAAAALSRANELEDNAYSAIWCYLARERGGENGRAELEAKAARLTSEKWPYPVIELYLGGRSPEQLLSLADKPEDRCEAEFYSGEWHLLRGDRVAATTHLRAAADNCPKNFDEYEGALAELKRLNL